jgi:hypothetical protein
MNPTTQNPNGSSSDPGEFPSSNSFEDTLRLIAHLSAPEGLEERVQAGLRAAPRAASGKARVLRWPMTPRLENAWMRRLWWSAAGGVSTRACSRHSQHGQLRCPCTFPHRAGFRAREPCARRRH